jgi:hypothetical protein
VVNVVSKDVMESHGQRLKAAMSNGFGGKNKFIITAGDEKVCRRCQMAEEDGVIPFDQPYSNGMMAPSFHGKTCRCIQVTSDELASALEVNADIEENAVHVGILEPRAARSASLREYGSGNGPPNPAIRTELDNIPDEVFAPLFNDLNEFYRKKFLGE